MTERRARMARALYNLEVASDDNINLADDLLRSVGYELPRAHELRLAKAVSLDHRRDDDWKTYEDRSHALLEHVRDRVRKLLEGEPSDDEAPA